MAEVLLGPLLVLALALLGWRIYLIVRGTYRLAKMRREKTGSDGGRT